MTRAGTNCQAFPGYTALADQNAPGNNIGSFFSSLQAAFEACTSNPVCAGFNSYYFYTKTTVASPSPERGVCLYVKTGGNLYGTALPRPVASFSRLRGPIRVTERHVHARAGASAASPPPAPSSGSSNSTIRLASGASASGWAYGRLEVLYNGTWGTVWCVGGRTELRLTWLSGSSTSSRRIAHGREHLCSASVLGIRASALFPDCVALLPRCSDDSFDDDDALVACRQLGFTRGSAVFRGNSTYPVTGGTGSILLDNVACNPAVHTAIEQCPTYGGWGSAGGWGVHNCVHSEDVGVYCSNSSSQGQPAAAGWLPAGTPLPRSPAPSGTAFRGSL